MSARDMVQSPRLRSITQGSVFNHAKCQDFSSSVLGLLVSARCDLAQKKQTRYVYVPLVTARDWLASYVIPRLFVEHRASLISTLKNILSDNKLSPTSIDTFGAAKSGELLQDAKSKKRYETKFNELVRVDEMIGSGVFDKSIISAKAIRSKTDELVSNKVEGAFFIDNVIDYQNGAVQLGAHVAILGEPSSIPRGVASRIADGLEHDSIEGSMADYSCIDIVSGEMSYVLCNVRSPYIELALQKFSAFYSRVGIEDPSQEIKELMAKEASE